MTLIALPRIEGFGHQHVRPIAKRDIANTGPITLPGYLPNAALPIAELVAAQLGSKAVELVRIETTEIKHVAHQYILGLTGLKGADMDVVRDNAQRVMSAEQLDYIQTAFAMICHLTTYARGNFDVPGMHEVWFEYMRRQAVKAYRDQTRPEADSFETRM